MFYLKKSVARSVANWVRMVGTVGTVHGYCTQYHTYVPMRRTYAPMSRTMRTLFTVPVVLSKPYLKKVAIRALLLKIDKLYHVLSLVVSGLTVNLALLISLKSPGT